MREVGGIRVRSRSGKTVGVLSPFGCTSVDAVDQTIFPNFPCVPLDDLRRKNRHWIEMANRSGL